MQRSEAAAQPSKAAPRRFGEDQKRESWPEKRLSYLKSCSLFFASSENWTKDERNRLCEAAETWFIFLCGIYLEYLLQFYQGECVHRRCVVRLLLVVIARVTDIVQKPARLHIGGLFAASSHNQQRCLFGKEVAHRLSCASWKEKNVGMFSRDKRFSMCRKTEFQPKNSYYSLLFFFFLISQLCSSVEVMECGWDQVTS